MFSNKGVKPAASLPSTAASAELQDLTLILRGNVALPVPNEI